MGLGVAREGVADGAGIFCGGGSMEGADVGDGILGSTVISAGEGSPRGPEGADDRHSVAMNQTARMPRPMSR